MSEIQEHPRVCEKCRRADGVEHRFFAPAQFFACDTHEHTHGISADLCLPCAHAANKAIAGAIVSLLGFGKVFAYSYFGDRKDWPVDAQPAF